ncbi:MAG TPA: hypothetical protein VGY99_07215 [Candidatus Binataceae bacterium]|jgi:hypothetical protein|nr:hypothetical protein [Candidatus Binataceae bacterium]
MENESTLDKPAIAETQPDRAAASHNQRVGAAAAAQIDPRLPLVIGVTGHRDLRPQARAAIADRVREVLLHFKTSYPNTPLIVLSPLAEGADRLVAEVALEPGIGAQLMAPLPMVREIYEFDFKSSDSRAEFDRLLDAAAQKLELPAPPGVSREQLQNELSVRQDQYAAVGEFVARHCQVLIALWDGKPGDRGGTAEVVKMKLDGVGLSGGRDSAVSVRRGPVYQITVPRQRDGARDVVVGCTALFPDTDSYEPYEAHDFYHHRVLKPLDDYNREVVMRSGEDGAAEQRAACDLLPDPEALPISQIDAGIRMMRRHYATADALANRYGAATNRTLLRLSLVVFMAALSFDLAVHILVEPRVLVLETLCLFGLPVLTGVAMLIHRQARRQDYQNRYQDYRGLAEGLRIQFFWRLAGVGECVADHYLGRHRYEMQWIRDACRSSLVAANCPLGSAGEEVKKAILEGWVDSQRRYFDRVAVAQERKLQRLERRIALCVWLGLVIVVGLGVWMALLAVKQSFKPLSLSHVHKPPELLYGGMLLAITMSAVFAALTHNYIEKLALITQVRMYERMRRLYRHHGEKLRNARGGDFVRGLFSLGREALVENGEWVMHHRERPLEVPHH